MQPLLDSRRARWAVLTACVMAACGGGGGDAAPRATWYQDVAPLLSQRCNSCHAEGGIGPFPLTDYATAKANASRMMHQIEIGAMPPFDAREEADCTPRFSWVDDPRLSGEQKELLQAWIDDGFALGTEAAIPPPPSQELTGVSRTLIPDLGHATSGDRDQFICYVLDPAVTSNVVWVNGLQVRPGLKEVVHHAVITELIAGAEQDALVAQHGIGKPFDCGTASVPAGYLVHIWTPGNQPMQTRPEIAVPLVRDAKLIMQIHYHPGGKAHAADRTAIDLRFSQEWPRKMYMATVFGNAAGAPVLQPGPGDRTAPEFRIPANSAEHVERMRATVPAIGDVRIFSVNPHMHLVGTHISASLERPAARGADPQKECLANGGWNFDWQRTYAYDAALDNLPSLAAGDVIEVTCRWNNTLANPFVQRMLKDANLPMQAIDVNLGEQTVDEMCLQIFGLSINAPPRPAALAEPAALDLRAFGESLQLMPGSLH